MLELFSLLVLFQIKHFICDYPLQGKYMLGKFKDGYAFILPLTAHAAVQASGTLLIVSCFNIKLWWLAIVDFILHFIVDRLKADKRLLGRWSYNQSYFWWALGFDQLTHHLLDILYVFLIWRNL